MESEKKLLTLPMVALRGLTVFPDMTVNFDAGREKSIRALDIAMRTGRRVFLITQRDVVTDDPKREDLYTTGTIAKVEQILKTQGEGVRVLVEGIDRGRLISITDNEVTHTATVEVLPKSERTATTPKEEALLRQCVEVFNEYLTTITRPMPNLLINIYASSDVGYVADYIAQNISMKFTHKQEVLEELDPQRRIKKVIRILRYEIDVFKIEKNLAAKVQLEMNKNQRDYMLREQLKIIRNELGEESGQTDEISDYRRRIIELSLPEETEKKLLTEVNRLSAQPFGSTEGAVIRTYLDTCLELPWNKYTKEKVNVEAARKLLDKDHFGLQKVKERILEFLAVKALAPDIKGQIICLVGPPGVGKTSVAISIAHALNRKLARLSLGGVRDEADIRGHRKTYVGAMPGRIMTAIKQGGSKNPLLLLDEIDKLSHDFHGDPAAALLEVLDTEQNHAFRDHYLEVPFDLSDVMFITTANTTSTIPRALLDRMEVIELSSYTDEEKLMIAKQHLLPKQMKRHGLSRSTLRVSDNALRELIAGYTRESGVRNLEREIAGVCRKAAMFIISGEKDKNSVTPTNLAEYAGVRKYVPEQSIKNDEVGVVTGLAWTSMGGEILQVEVNAVEGTGKLELTGNLGDVMKESVHAAITYIRSRAKAFGIPSDFYKTTDIHVHFPEAAVPKDGPSAGITVATAIVSALTNAPARAGIAMTGEITLRGRVLPIGGLKEKTMAALRAGIKTVIIPSENEKDLSEIDQTVRNALHFVTVSDADAVMDIAIDFSRRPGPEDESKDEPGEKELPPPILNRSETPFNADSVLRQ
ncbi:MAG: endopeptidase La [Clostridiales bacterium]|nr:endopeptidase La [Clostridiales bacterium]